MTANKKTGIIFVLLSAIFFASGGLLIKINTWSPMSINGARCFFAFFVMLIYVKLTKHQLVMNKVVVFGAVANFGMSLTFTMANKLTTAANAIVLQFIMPVFLILLLWAFWKQKPDKVSVATVLVSLVGLLCFFIESLSIGGMLGNALAVLSGFLYAIVFLIKKIPGSDFESSVLLSYVISFVVGIPSLIVETSYSSLNIATVIALGIFQMGMAFVCLNVGLNSVNPVAASLISMIEPVLNPILVALVYGETIGVLGLVGAVIVLGSATFYNLSRIKLSPK